MEDDFGSVCATDATPEYNNKPDFDPNSKKYKEICTYLNQDDFRKIHFLLNGVYSFEENNSPNLSPDFILKNWIKNTLHYLKRPKGHDLELLKEVLYHIKKHCLLFKLSSCKHQVKKEKQLWHIPKQRCHLFHICESLDDEDLKYLAKELYPELNCNSTELLLNHLEKDEKIKDLEVHFKMMKRNDLQPLLRNYLDGNNYYDLTTDPGVPCGLAAIFNNYKFDKFDNLTPEEFKRKGKTKSLREGTKKDEENLRKVFEDFNLRVETYNDFTSKEILAKINKLANFSHSENKVFICCFLSHGSEDTIFGSDGLEVRLKDIFKEFGRNSPGLDGKPKIFFVQACQGINTQQGTLYRHENKSDDSIRKDGIESDHAQPDLPFYADILIGISTVPGYLSFRHQQDGAFYIQKLTEVLEKSGDKEDLASLLADVNRAVADEKLDFKDEKGLRQMPTFHSQLRYKLQFKRKQ